MVFKNKLVNKFWRFSSSFQLGIPVMVALGVLVAWGTIVESQYDAAAAKKIVYESWMMFVTMSLLVYNLTIVVFDRWPWKWRHYPFIVVHAGMITIIAGGYVTQKFGLDGQMVVPIGGKNNMASVSFTDLVVFATFDGDRYTKIADREVDFFLNPPTPEKPYEL
jgi:cytochrome c biogenesis factor